MISIDEDFNIDKEIRDDGNSTSVRSQKRKNMSISDVLSSKRKEGSDTFVSAVYDEVFMVSVLDENQKLEAYAWFLENERQFKILKNFQWKRKESEF